MTRSHPISSQRTIALLALATVGTWTLFHWPTPILLLGPTILYFSRTRIRPSLISPIWIVVCLVSGIGLLGYAIYGNQPSPDLRLIFVIDHELAGDTAFIFGVSSALMAAGALLSTAYGRSVKRPNLQMVVTGSTAKIAIFCVAVFPLILGCIAFGYLVSRPLYIGKADGSLIGAIGTVTLAGLVAAGYLFRSNRGLIRWPIAALILIQFAIVFSLGSRQFALAPVALAFGGFLWKPDAGGRNWLIFAGAVSVLLLPIPLYLRGLPAHGFAEYLPALGSMKYGLIQIKEGLGNLALGFPQTGITAFQSRPIDGSDILVALNPLPGRLAGWYEISSQMRISPVFPYTAIGEAWNVGAGLAMPLFVGIGVVLGYLGRRVNHLAAQGRRIAALSICGLAILSGLYLTSYNLRNATRPLWYAVAIDLATRMPLMQRRRIVIQSKDQKRPTY